MISAKSAGWPAVDRWPARFHSSWRTVPAAVGAIAVAAALLALTPLVSLIFVALGETGDLWAHLARYVLPVALGQTALLLAGVAAVTSSLGVGTAWIVTTFDFPGRDALTWLLPLPLAIPTYIVAYVYVDILDALGPVQSALRAVFGWRSAADYWFPNVRSLGGAILVIGFVLYPYVYLAARAMFQTQGALFTEAARMLGARPWQLARRITLPLARPAIAVGVALALLETLNDIGASEYLGVQTLTLSIFTTWLNRGSLAGRRADGLPHAADRRRADRARTLWPPPPWTSPSRRRTPASPRASRSRARRDGSRRSPASFRSCSASCCRPAISLREVDRARPARRLRSATSSATP